MYDFGRWLFVYNCVLCIRSLTQRVAFKDLCRLVGPVWHSWESVALRGTTHELPGVHMTCLWVFG